MSIKEDLIMRQVPTGYLIIGRGRLATHLSHYFQLLSIPHQIWTRENTLEELSEWSQNAPRILLAIKDDAIESFISKHHLPREKTIHFSGTLSLSTAIRLHPLMTFTKEMYSLADYLKIPFIGEEGSLALQQLIPELSNPYYEIPKSNQDLYHSLCVLAGNGTIVLWQEIFKSFETQLKLPKEVLLPYLEQVCKNLQNNPDGALTGPWVRDDIATITKNKKALEHTTYLPLYLSLLNVYQSHHPQSVDSARSIQ
jgi:2-dehydropantoate 2-reductase